MSVQAATLPDLFRAIGHSANTLAEAIEEDDAILGTMASASLLICIGQLPAELREDMVSALTEPHEMQNGGSPS